MKPQFTLEITGEGTAKKIKDALFELYMELQFRDNIAGRYANDYICVEISTEGGTI